MGTRTGKKQEYMPDTKLVGMERGVGSGQRPVG